MLERTHRDYDLHPTCYPYSSHKWVDELITASTELAKKLKKKNKEERLPCLNLGTNSDKHEKKKCSKISTWNTENRFRFKVLDMSQRPVERPPFLVTTLDPRKHNPQSKQIFHIHRINAKPVCKVHTWVEDKMDVNEDGGKTTYKSSYKLKSPSADRQPPIKSKDKETMAHGIVPFDQPADSCNVREEMLLPICETTNIPSAPHPHKYLLRKKKAPPCFDEAGVFYDPEDGHSLPEFPYKEMRLHRESTMPDRVCISSLQGMEFSRKRYIPPPCGSFSVAYFDGGPPSNKGSGFNEKYIPFLRVKTII
ncbi:uncharacterized protein LOC133192051 [Saccostrea echinata]|uniref:uncharacterized protein LOC133192051 n=1 Tax=Saccostrea echinata TaxID=191078 RepID=UPI002A821686|nr:uncharacterized protein LOC133192051 [Saccostrea echinata]